MVSMERALDATAYIYQGCWINWSKGRIWGLTLTLSTANSTLLTNLLALFVAMAGSQFWTIARFTLHQFRASNRARECSMLYNKEQMVLRNTTSPLTTAQLLLTLRWASRKHVSERPPSTIPIAVFAILSAAFFLVAGAFSNTMASAGPHVLSRSPLCGFWNQTYFDAGQVGLNAASLETLKLSDESIAKWERDTEISLQYVEACYLGKSTGPSDCNMFQKSTLNFSTSHVQTCPFAKEICKPGIDTVVFDTGFIDSDIHLGINAEPEGRISYRKVTKCTVLDNNKYTTGWINQSVEAQDTNQPKLEKAYAHYGHSYYMNTNETYSYSNFADFYTNFAGEWSISYQLATDWAFGNSSGSNNPTFRPIAELATILPTADLYLLHLGFTGSYVEPIDDPWFSAHEKYHLNTTLPYLQTTYSRDRPISTIGCSEQHQICILDRCTDLTGFGQMQDYIVANMALTPRQNITLDRVLRASETSSLGQVTWMLAWISAPVLAIEERLSESHTISMPLPKDQWKNELAYWQYISMAGLQRLIVEYGTGQISPQPKYLLPPQTDEEKWICQNLMIRSTVYQSFSILALSFMIASGLLVMLLSLYIEEVAAWIWHRLGRGNASELWKDHDMLSEQEWRSRALQFINSDSQISIISHPTPCSDEK